MTADARDVLAWLPENSIGRIFILFPDPWPKKRHQKRRLVAHETMAQIARVLKPGGELRFASDSVSYAGEALLTILANGAFAWTADTPRIGGSGLWTGPKTRYERKALSDGRKPAYLSFPPPLTLGG